MTIMKALKLIVENQDNPSLNYAINYAKYAIRMLVTEADLTPSLSYTITKAIRVQLLYVLTNIGSWRANKRFSITAGEIREVRKTLKQYSKE